METPHCRCIPQVKATDVNEVLNRFSTSLLRQVAGTTQNLKASLFTLGRVLWHH